MTDTVPAPAGDGDTVATFGYDGCLTPGAIYATHIATGQLSVTVDYGRELPIDEQAAEELDTAVHGTLERILAPYWGEQPQAAPGADGAEFPPPLTAAEAAQLAVAENWQPTVDALRALVWDMLDKLPASPQALSFAIRAGQLGVIDQDGNPLVPACAHAGSTETGQ